MWRLKYTQDFLSCCFCAGIVARSWVVVVVVFDSSYFTHERFISFCFTSLVKCFDRLSCSLFHMMTLRWKSDRHGLFFFFLLCGVSWQMLNINLISPLSRFVDRWLNSVVWSLSVYRHRHTNAGGLWWFLLHLETCLWYLFVWGYHRCMFQQTSSGFKDRFMLFPYLLQWLLCLKYETICFLLLGFMW